MFILVDGIYPEFTRFVKGISQPIDEKEKRFTKWQESARKDIERAFGVLQQKFQFVAQPILLLDIIEIGRRVRTCLLLHNMVVSDRVMDGDVYAVYNPANQCIKGVRVPHKPVDHEEEFPAMGIRNIPGDHNVNAIVERWNCLVDKEQHQRLQKALQDNF